MAQSVTARLRKLWFDVHLWLGVGLFILIAPVALTGSLLVWSQQLGRMAAPERYEVSAGKPDLPPAAYVAAAEKAFAGRARTSYLRLPTVVGDPVTVTGKIPGNAKPPRQLTAWLDPKTARVTGVDEVSATWLSFASRIHGTMMIPKIGRKVVGTLGLALAISTFTGIWLWWPRGGGFIKGLRWRRTPMTMDNLHHLIGFWVSVPLAAVALTGVYMSFPIISRGIHHFTDPRPAANAPKPVKLTGPAPGFNGARMKLDEALATALKATPGAHVTAVAYPSPGREPAWRLELVTADGAPASLNVVDATGEAKVPPPSGERSDPISSLMRKIHDGYGAGPVWQTIIVIAGMAPTALGITGIVMWLRSRKRKAALRAL